jgi:hypothetical protein
VTKVVAVDIWLIKHVRIKDFDWDYEVKSGVIPG